MGVKGPRLIERLMTRDQWKVVWRLLRVSRRESAKAALDTMLHGIGCTYVGPDGIRHVPAEELFQASDTK